VQNTSYFTCDSVCEKKKSFKNDGKETETDMEQKGHHNNDTGGRRERELKTQVAPTWRAVAQEIRFLFGFVTLEALVSSSVRFLYDSSPCIPLCITSSYTAYLPRTNYRTSNFKSTVYRWPEPSEAKGRKIRWNLRCSLEKMRGSDKSLEVS